MKVRYADDDCVPLTKEKIYDVIAIELGNHKIINNTKEDDLPPLAVFNIAE